MQVSAARRALVATQLARAASECGEHAAVGSDSLRGYAALPWVGVQHDPSPHGFLLASDPRPEVRRLALRAKFATQVRAFGL